MLSPQMAVSIQGMVVHLLFFYWSPSSIRNASVDNSPMSSFKS
jgi:hypothetical protein